MKQRLNYWSGVFWSPEFYANAMRPGGNLGFLALGAAMLLATVLQAAIRLPELNDVQKNLHALADKLPAFTVQDGKISAQGGNLPQVIDHQLTDGTKVRVVVDTSKVNLTAEDLAPFRVEHTQILGVASQSLHHFAAMSEGSWKLQTRSINPDMKDATVDQPVLHALIDQLPKLAWFLLPALWIARWIGAVLLALLLGSVGNAAKPRAAANSRYPDMVRVGSYSLIPFVLVTSILTMPLGILGLFGAAILHYLLVLQLAKRALPPEAPAV